MCKIRFVWLYSLCGSLFIAVSGVAQSGGILGGASRTPDAIASDVLDQLLLEVQGDTKFATCYVGSFVNEGRSDPFANGIFEFVGFYARTPVKTGGGKIRLWSSNDANINGDFEPYGYTFDRMFDGKQWLYTDFGGRIKTVDPAEKEGHLRIRGLCLDSRIAMRQYAYGIYSGKARTLSHDTSFMSVNLIEAKRLKNGNITAVVQGTGSARFHCTLDRQVEFRPVRVAVTKGNQALAQGEANAIVVNEVHWKKEGDRWLAVAGTNTQYGGGTKQRAPRAISYDWKAAWWFDDDVPEDFFQKKHMTSLSGDLFSEFKEYIDKVAGEEQNPKNKDDRRTSIDS